MTILRLIADDLTGALDTAAEFVPLTGPVAVCWDLPKGRDGSIALDSGTREKSKAEATATVAGMATHLVGADIAYKKVDSLLRGHTMAELAACWRVGAWDHCIIAPAFPHQGRVTKRGIQFRKEPSGAWTRVADLAALAAESSLDVEVHECGTRDPLQKRVHLFDAQTNEDLFRIADCGRAAPGRVLWCGSAGLAQALVGKAGTGSSVLAAPLLGLFGSDQSVTARQLAACGRHWIALADGGEASALALSRKLERDGVVFASFDLPAGLSRVQAARRIAALLDTLLPRLERPNTLAVAGGETLRTVCSVLGATRLDATGQIEPGLPRSVLRGGKWDGVFIVSKSGAFGADGLWRDLLRSNGFAAEKAYS
jgi:uncharacterized protein YgbK (DUF1537 family)